MPSYTVECLNREVGERFDLVCHADTWQEAILKAKAHNLSPVRVWKSDPPGRYARVTPLGQVFLALKAVAIVALVIMAAMLFINESAEATGDAVVRAILRASP